VAPDHQVELVGLEDLDHALEDLLRPGLRVAELGSEEHGAVDVQKHTRGIELTPEF
jgi:hypothetical protein